jgi:hypothetical protein
LSLLCFVFFDLLMVFTFINRLEFLVVYIRSANKKFLLDSFRSLLVILSKLFSFESATILLL